MTIKIERAIEVLQKRIDGAMLMDNRELIASWKLGVTAMKRIQRLRADGQFIGMPVLKGETPPETST
jgi:hypothetical protein